MKKNRAVRFNDGDTVNHKASVKNRMRRLRQEDAGYRSRRAGKVTREIERGQLYRLGNRLVVATRSMFLHATKGWRIS